MRALSSWFDKGGSKTSSRMPWAADLRPERTSWVTFSLWMNMCRPEINGEEV